MDELSSHEVRVLAAFPAPPGETYGRALSNKTGLDAGTVLRCLYRLERRGYIQSRWEDAERARREHRWPRRFYRLTDQGARELVHQPVLRGILGSLTWSPVSARPRTCGRG